MKKPNRMVLFTMSTEEGPIPYFAFADQENYLKFRKTIIDLIDEGVERVLNGESWFAEFEFKADEEEG